MNVVKNLRSILSKNGLLFNDNIRVYCAIVKTEREDV